MIHIQVHHIGAVNLIISLLGISFSTTNSSSSSGSNKTNLTTSTGSSLNSGGFANVLVVTTTMRMFHRVHCHTPYFRPAIALGLVFMVCTSGFQNWLVNSPTTSNNTLKNTNMTTEDNPSSYFHRKRGGIIKSSNQNSILI